MSAPAPKPVLSKIDVAKRQLDTAVWLWFHDGDVVSIRLLAGSAFGVIADLIHHRTKERPYPFGHAPEGVTQKEWINMIKACEDFSKHARTDPDAVQEYDPERTKSYLYYACLALVTALIPGDYDYHGLRCIFLIHCALVRGDSVTQTPYPFGKTVNLDDLKNLSRAEFFQKRGGDFRGHPPTPDVPGKIRST